jgi:hypothetical protein
MNRPAHVLIVSCLVACIAASAVVCAAMAACGDSPTAPSAAATTTAAPTIVGLSVDQGTLALVRYGTAQVTATVTKSDGTKQDVTASSAWTSSNPEIAAAQAGFVVATGTGSTRISVGYGGFVRAVDVTVRRRTAFRGTVGVYANDRAGQIVRLAATLDRVVVGDCQVTGTYATGCGITVGNPGFAPELFVGPGTHVFAVRIDAAAGLASLAAQVIGTATIVDPDTATTLVQLWFSRPATVINAGSSLEWTFDVAAYQ